jgi:hypothetical protein
MVQMEAQATPLAHPHHKAATVATALDHLTSPAAVEVVPLPLAAPLLVLEMAAQVAMAQRQVFLAVALLTLAAAVVAPEPLEPHQLAAPAAQAVVEQVAHITLLLQPLAQPTRAVVVAVEQTTRQQQQAALALSSSNTLFPSNLS